MDDEKLHGYFIGIARDLMDVDSRLTTLESKLDKLSEDFSNVFAMVKLPNPIVELQQVQPTSSLASGSDEKKRG